MKDHLLAFSSTDPDHHAAGMTLFSAAFAGVVTTVSIVVEDVADIAALEHRSTSIAYELLNLVEQEMVKLLTRKRVSGFQALDVLFW